MLKRDSWLWFGIEMLLIFVGLLVFLFAMFRLPENMAKIVICFFGIIAILFCDNSCITRKIKEKIPRSSILYRKKRKNLDEMTERYKTAAYLCLLVRFATPFMGWITMGWGIDNHKYPIHFWILWIVISLVFIILFLYIQKNTRKSTQLHRGFVHAFSFLFLELSVQ